MTTLKYNGNLLCFQSQNLIHILSKLLARAAGIYNRYRILNVTTDRNHPKIVFLFLVELSSVGKKFLQKSENFLK